MQSSQIDYRYECAQIDAQIVAISEFEGKTLVVLDNTCCHARDLKWSDQSADKGVLRFAGQAFDLCDCFAFTQADELALSFAAELDDTVKLVAHVVDVNLAECPFKLGDVLRVERDQAHRLAMSAGHTACHIACIAINKAMHGFWKKPVPCDDAEHYDFDKLALRSSVIHDYGSEDIYSLSKSMKKKGLDIAAVKAAVGEIEQAINDDLYAWSQQGIGCQLNPQQGTIADFRQWQGQFNGWNVTIPCGGTHLQGPLAIQSLAVSLVLDDSTLVMTTRLALNAA